MSRYARAKAELERTLVVSAPRRVLPDAEPQRYTTPPGVHVRRWPPKIELTKLPVPPDSDVLGLRVDATTGRASFEVSSYGEAVRVLLRCELRRLDDVIHVDGTPMRAGELLAKAAAEFGDDDTSRRILAQLRSDLVSGFVSELAVRGPAVHGCERGRCG